MDQTQSKIKYGDVFEYTKDAFDAGNEILIHRGGTGSGKTEDIMIYLIFEVALKEKDKVITIVSESRPHLEIGAIRILKKHIINSGWWNDNDYNVSLGRYISPTNTIIEFFSADRIGKALGARRDWLYGNEINSLKPDVWDELARRSRYVIADFNPTHMFWLEKWLTYQEKYKVIKTNYTNNPCLPDYEKKKILKQAETDANFRRVHIDCEYGIYEGLVFTEWQQVDELPEGGIVVFGLDFGYTNDPTALVKVVIKGGDLFVDELLYRTGLLNRDIANLMKKLGVGNHEVYADSAEPKSIHEIYLSGYNIKPAIKGPGSVNAGIDKIKSYNLKVTKRSVSIIKELRNYAWVSDKEGNPTNKPIDAFNHGCDSIRYAIYRDEERTSDPEELKGVFY